MYRECNAMIWENRVYYKTERGWEKSYAGLTLLWHSLALLYETEPASEKGNRFLEIPPTVAPDSEMEQLNQLDGGPAGQGQIWIVLGLEVIYF